MIDDRVAAWPPTRAVPRRHPDVLVEVLDGEAVLYDERTAGMHVLDPVATVVWQCLDGDGTLADLAADLAGAFGAPPQQVRDDVAALLAWLEDYGLLEGTAPPEGLHPEDAGGGPRVFRPRPYG